jgi:hypothetical protein
MTQASPQIVDGGGGLQCCLLGYGGAEAESLGTNLTVSHTSSTLRWHRNRGLFRRRDESESPLVTSLGFFQIEEEGEG